ncbi:Holliday junction resolvase RuvX [Candidatus Dependentiae bacterium]
MRILALDIGDVWIGSAISDPLGVTCKPHKTVKTQDVVNFICEEIDNNNVDTVVTGVPYTMSGKEGNQAKKVEEFVKNLRKAIGEKNKTKIKWATWDERKTSQYAEKIARQSVRSMEKLKKTKIHQHSIAAAFILQGYLDHMSFKKGLY